jgi:hypothetical protein
MKNWIVSRLLPVAAVAVLGGFAGSAGAAVNGPGIHFKAAFASDASCFSRYSPSFAGLINNCASSREIIATLPLTQVGWHPTSVSIYGNNSWCQSLSTNGVGNAAQVGPEVWTTAGPMNWQTLNLGDRYNWGWSPLVYRCWLQSGGIIGSFSAGN